MDQKSGNGNTARNLARMPLINSYRMLENDRVTAFTVSELLRENQQEF